jgi:methylated-DNA-[protein]-cysteine S-methyltransferase
MNESTIYRSPIGEILISAGNGGLTALCFTETPSNHRDKPDDKPSNRFLGQCRDQLEEYFAGGRTVFDVPFDIDGTLFQMKVWRALLLIPYGSTWSYGKLAAQIGRPKASRAVGGANHKNPISIIVPCHRVIGSDGKLTGYGGGLWRKEWLIAHESKIRS